MANYEVKAAVVKVAVGAADGNRVARILRSGSPIPDGVDQGQLDALEKRGLIRKVRAPRKTTVGKPDDQSGKPDDQSGKPDDQSGKPDDQSE